MNKKQELNSSNIQGRSLVLCDIDGVLLYHYGSLDKLVNNPTVVLDGVKEKLQEWYLRDHKIILTTGRQASMRKFTEKQLEEAGIFYHSLIMDVGRGPRAVINDCKPDSTEPTALSFSLERNKGLRGIDI